MAGTQGSRNFGFTFAGHQTFVLSHEHKVRSLIVSGKGGSRSSSVTKRRESRGCREWANRCGLKRWYRCHRVTGSVRCSGYKTSGQIGPTKAPEKVTGHAEFVGELLSKHYATITQTGHKEAFDLIKGAAPTTITVFGPAESPEHGSHGQQTVGIQSTLAEQLDNWGTLWQASDGDSSEADFRSLLRQGGQVPLGERLSVDTLRNVAAKFSPGTAALDGVTPRQLGMLSDAGLQALSLFFQLFEWCARWPTSESIVLTVLLPKPSGGLRPIALFRAVVRLYARARVSRLIAWIGTHTTAVCNTMGGRDICDGTCRAAMRAQKINRLWPKS
jgi:hypothetical protein